MPEEVLNQIVVFKLGDEEYGVDVMDVKEIAKPTSITNVPRAPPFIEGVFNLRGGLAPLINLRRRFGFKSKEIDENARIVIAELEDKPIGMLVDAATEVLGIPTEDIETTPDMVTTEISKDYLKGVGKVGDRLIIILDLKQVLTKKDMEQINLIEDENIMTEGLSEPIEETEKEKEQEIIEEEPKEEVETEQKAEEETKKNTEEKEYKAKEEMEKEQPKKEPDELEKSKTNQRKR